ncbi:MAG: vitamin K epoxide reductase family protein [Candidatus Thermoplasmatota archaeon]|nr:vitamin K epoxide reductase family protein [Candidatus Thermoplasmatota archaeon]
MEATSWRAVLYLTLAGLGLSSYLTAVSFVTADLSYCSPNPFLSCEAVIYSPYSRILGIPVALVSAVGFAALFIVSYMALLSRKKSGTALVSAAAVLSTLGLAFGAYLTYLELFVIDSLCALCFATFLIIIPVFLLSIRGLWAHLGSG